MLMAHIVFLLDLDCRGPAQGDHKEKLFGELLAESLLGEETGSQ